MINLLLIVVFVAIVATVKLSEPRAQKPRARLADSRLHAVKLVR